MLSNDLSVLFNNILARAARVDAMLAEIKSALALGGKPLTADGKAILFVILLGVYLYGLSKSRFGRKIGTLPAALVMLFFLMLFCEPYYPHDLMAKYIPLTRNLLALAIVALPIAWSFSSSELATKITPTRDDWIIRTAGAIIPTLIVYLGNRAELKRFAVKIRQGESFLALDNRYICAYYVTCLFDIVLLAYAMCCACGTNNHAVAKQVARAAQGEAEASGFSRIDAVCLLVTGILYRNEIMTCIHTSSGTAACFILVMGYCICHAREWLYKTIDFVDTFLSL